MAPIMGSKWFELYIQVVTNQESQHQARGYQELSCPQSTPHKELPQCNCIHVGWCTLYCIDVAYMWHVVHLIAVACVAQSTVQGVWQLLLKAPSMIVKNGMICDGVASFLVQSILGADDLFAFF